MTVSKPIAVLISDVHYSLQNLELSDKAFRTAIAKAAELGVPLIDAGDITNDKAILRGEVVNRLIDTMLYAKAQGVKVGLLVGNHSLLNEKGTDHALNFLRPYVEIYDTVGYLWATKLMLIPYQNDSDKLKTLLSQVVPGTTLIMHQGFLGAAMGDYIQDKTSIDPALVKDFTVISGHYHRHQTLTLLKVKEAEMYPMGVGTVTYIGSPFSMSFGEANDGPKGFLILNSDGTYTREILNLRRHVKIETDLDNLYLIKHKDDAPTLDDLVWLKVSGPYSELQKLDKQEIAARLVLSNLKLDLIPTDAAPVSIPVETLSAGEVFDSLINSSTESNEQKTKLRRLWRDLIEGDC